MKNNPLLFNAFRFFLIAYLTLTSPRARADILFIDMNVNNQEVAAAQAAAKARGEKLVVIPNIPQDVRDQVAKLKAAEAPLEEKLDALDSQYNKIATPLLTGKLPPDQAAVAKAKADAIYAQITALNNQETPIDNQLNSLINVDQYHVTKASINQVLTQYDQQGRHFDSLVISSHHVSDFYSDYGSELDESDLSAVIEAHPAQQKNLASVYFWGCYNGAPMTMLFWKNTFPSAHVIAGWDGLAPEEHRAIDEDFLKDMLIKEKSISDIADAKEMLAAYRAIPGISSSSAAFGDFCGPGLWVGPGGVTTFNSSKAKCDPGFTDDVQSNFLVAYNNYMAATAGTDYAEVPADPHHSELRNDYTKFREIEDCPGMENTKSLVPQMLNLIFFKTIEKNFQTFFGADLAKASQILKTDPEFANLHLTVPEVPDLSNPAVTRQQVIAFAATLGGDAQAIGGADRTFLLGLWNHLNQNLVNLTGIDATWLTPASSAAYLTAPVVTAGAN